MRNLNSRGRARPVKDRILEILRESNEGMTVDEVWFALGGPTRECVRVHLAQLGSRELVDKVPPPKLEVKWIIALDDNED
jgi:hypothetical protein